jgi:hypothetical protein
MKKSVKIDEKICQNWRKNQSQLMKNLSKLMKKCTKLTLILSADSVIVFVPVWQRLSIELSNRWGVVALSTLALAPKKGKTTFFSIISWSTCWRAGWPGWANCRLLGEYFLRVVFLKNTKVGYFYQRLKLCIYFDKKWVGPHFGRFCSKLV